jgi:hypothetical protein
MSGGVRELALFKNTFSTCGYEIIKFLDKKDIDNLKLTNKFINDICECHSMLSTSIKSLGTLFTSSVEQNTDFFKKLSFFESNNDSIFMSTGQSFTSTIGSTSFEKKNSKFKEKFNFNKPIEEYYKESDKYQHRLQSAKKKI